MIIWVLLSLEVELLVLVLIYFLVLFFLDLLCFILVTFHFHIYGCNKYKNSYFEKVTVNAGGLWVASARPDKLLI